MNSQAEKTLQNADDYKLPQIQGQSSDTLSQWEGLYFSHETTTRPNTEKQQRRVIRLFIGYVLSATGSEERSGWTPRLSKDFLSHLKGFTKGATPKEELPNKYKASGYSDTEAKERRWGDSSIRVFIAHIKAFSKWVDRMTLSPTTPFEPWILGDPMRKIENSNGVTRLKIEKALTPQEVSRLLSACDELLIVGGISKDRKRHGARPPQRKGYRPYRNRALIYLLIGSGMRRAGAVNLNLSSYDPVKKEATTTEKGGKEKTYMYSKEAIKAIDEYIENERGGDSGFWKSPALFLPDTSSKSSKGRLSPDSVNRIWKEACNRAGIVNKSPHSARHAAGKKAMDKTGNIRVAQLILGHDNINYTSQYCDPTHEELRGVLDD